MKELEARVKELWPTVGRKQIMIDYLEKMMKITKDELDIIINKKLRHPTINWFRENKQKMSFSLNSLYKEVGLSKQAVAQFGTRQKIFDNKTAQLVLEADELREDHPGCGVEKMYHTLKPNFMGRDWFIELVMKLRYRLKRIKNYRRTTIA